MQVMRQFTLDVVVCPDRTINDVSVADHISYIFITQRTGRVISALALYLADPGFRSKPGDFRAFTPSTFLGSTLH